MQLGQVIGTLIATHKAPNLDGVKLLVVQLLDRHSAPSGQPQIAADATGQAGVGERVMLIASREAAQALERTFAPVDLAIVGIVDEISTDLPGFPKPGRSDPQGFQPIYTPADDTYCWLCNGPVVKRPCKIVCAQCGFVRDCSDP